MKMVVFLNGREIETSAQVLADLISEQDLKDVKVATALNGQFIPSLRRRDTALNPGDRVEIVSPRQGG